MWENLVFKYWNMEIINGEIYYDEIEFSEIIEK